MKLQQKQGFIAVPGGNVWYKIVGKKGKTPLMVLHGGPGYPHDYLEPMEDLANEREVIFYDQLGCGNSDKPDDLSLWTVERFVKELEVIVGSLKLQKYHIIGQSWGTALAVSYALTKPLGLQSITLSDPFLSTLLWEKDAKKYLQQLPHETLKIIEKYNALGKFDSEEFKKAADEYYKLFVWHMYPLPEALSRSDKKMSHTIYNYMWGPKEFSATGTLSNFDVTNSLHKILLPILLLCGLFDESSPDTTKYYQSLFPNADMKVFNNSAHLPFWTDRYEFMQTVRKFLKTVD